jgi:predicted transcriptional regulator
MSAHPMPYTLRILRELADNGPATRYKLAENLDCGVTTVRYALGQLTDSQLVEKVKAPQLRAKCASRDPYIYSLHSSLKGSD